MLRTLTAFSALLLLSAAAPAPFDMPGHVLPPAAAPGADVEPVVKMEAGPIALTHVRVIDGTGAPAQSDRTLLIENGRIAAIQAASDAVPGAYKAIDATGKSVMPGLV